MQCEESGADAIVKRVYAARDVFERIAALKSRPSDDALSDATVNDELQGIIDDLQHHVVERARRPAFVATGSASLMEAGVELYNASRSTLKAMEKNQPADETDAKSSSQHPLKQQSSDNSILRYWIITSRFWACKIMTISLWQSKSSGAQEQGENKNQSHYSHECVDVLRCFGRVGALLLENAKVDIERCRQYFRFANEAFSCCHQIWSQIGLSYLTKLKQDLELEEILEDLWDFNMDRIRVLQFIDDDAENDASASSTNATVEALGELQMLVPYMPTYRVHLLKLVKETSDIYKKAGRHQDQVLLTEEALRICDSMDSCFEDGEEETLQQFKQSLLVNVLETFGAMKDFQRAETCYSLLPQQRDSDAVLTMVKISVDAQRFDKALNYLKILFELDHLENSILGARIYAQAQAYSDESLEVYQALERSYGDNNLEINLDLACNLALSGIAERRMLSIAELKRLGSKIQELESDGSSRHSTKHAERIHRTIFDAAQHNLNHHSYEVCIEWAELGASIAVSQHESGSYTRILSLCNLRLGRMELALKLARDAVGTDPSKKSLFCLFNAELEGLAPFKQITESLRDVVKSLKARTDFEAADLIALAKVAHDAGLAKQMAVLEIMDELCTIVAQYPGSMDQVPAGILLQHTAQLSFKCLSEGEGHTNYSTESDQFVKGLKKYAGILLEASKVVSKAGLGPPSVVEWFYAMCFNIAKSSDSVELFVLAAEISRISEDLYRDDNPLKYRQQQCLLAAIACSMKSIESLDKSQLKHLLEIVGQCEGCLVDEGQGIQDELEYLAKCVFTIKVRLFDPNTEGILKLCQAKMPRQTDEFAHLAAPLEFVLYAAKFDEASEVRKSYKLLASDLFKYSLQVMVQSDAVACDKLCYLFRRLIYLAEAKATIFEWLGQFIQLSGSLELHLAEDDVEWLVAKSWNIVSAANFPIFMDVHAVQLSKRISNIWCSTRALYTTEIKNTMMQENSWMRHFTFSELIALHCREKRVTRRALEVQLAIPVSELSHFRGDKSSEH